MRKTTLITAITALLFSGSALAGGEHGKEDAMKSGKEQATDMSVEKIDRANAVQAFNKADENSDFKLTKSEAERIKGLEKRFSRLDSDGDGALDYSEFRSLTQTGGDTR